jgi:hypothetical protein
MMLASNASETSICCPCPRHTPCLRHLARGFLLGLELASDAAHSRRHLVYCLHSGNAVPVLVPTISQHHSVHHHLYEYPTS